MWRVYKLGKYQMLSKEELQLQEKEKIKEKAVDREKKYVDLEE